MTMIHDRIPEEGEIREMDTDSLKPLSLKSNRRLWLVSDDGVLKVTDDTSDYESAVSTFQMRAALYNSGIPVPESVEVVKTKYGYGMVSERIRGLSMFELMLFGVYMPDEAGAVIADLAHDVHRVRLGKPYGLDYHKRFDEWAKGMAGILPEDEWQRTMALVDSIPETDTIVHGDLHPANILIQNGRPVLVDLDLTGYGNPVFDFACLRSRLMLPTKRVRGFFDAVPFLPQYIGLLWLEILKHYYPDKSMEELAKIDEQLTILSRLEHSCFTYHAHEKQVLK